jgi:hypothetical protein
MPTMNLSDAEAQLIARRRLTPDQRTIAVLTAVEAARQARLAAMTPDARAAAEKSRTEKLAAEAAERFRLAAMPEDARDAEMLLRRRERLTADLEAVQAALADPQTAALVAKVQAVRLTAEVK